jgi:two-component system cell cycle sensor histidine kinase/response regulator CckA
MVVNLITNARDAMPDGGSLKVRLRVLDVMDISALKGLERGRYAEISVSDSGEGMSEEQIRQAFDPFYSTKPVGAGTGLGLATVRSVAEQCGGGAFIDSAIGHGTSVRVLLPLTTEQPVEHPETKSAPTSLEGNETILVVEDEEGIRKLVAKSLRDLGYHVITACDGAEALEVAIEGDARLDLVISDVVMPRLSGPKFIQQLRRTRPDVKAILMSGYAQQDALVGDRLGEGATILEKPFLPSVLLNLVRKVLDHG